ncbi:DUF6249 domain-containing protein [Caulobacter sp. NIBR2454]|uniref:DUF6249 domain-containing protein n=1 Tax=Caulobacter sp. NIBR2454 TaxID=3015996 RepID=UPI0022B67E38|nr:DUF6249 domain-containing protein [Caulobacter sp. NIBR2454]
MEILIPLAPFIMVVAIVVIPKWLRSRERQEMQATIRAAIDKGQELPPELIEAMSKDVKVRKVSTAQSDIRTGIILIAVGAGIAAFGWMVGYEESDAVYPLMGIGLIPGLIGIAYVVLSFFNPNKTDRIEKQV